ncbi:MAG TPA: hypothetical protein VEL07_19135 [Planctomycetota bacterium]|nr:hypothetical protein [Planctomycetota bacterium]
MPDPNSVLAADAASDAAWWLDQLQWPAAAIGILGAWLVGALARRSRRLGFWCFLASNVLWITWGMLTGNWGLVAMQAAFTITSLRGVLTNREPTVSAG